LDVTDEELDSLLFLFLTTPGCLELSLPADSFSRRFNAILA
jgi:hypothetical protein